MLVSSLAPAGPALSADSQTFPGRGQRRISSPCEIVVVDEQGHSNMAKALIFGSPEPNIQYIERRAAYVVIINDCKVAMVKSRQTHFLPGGGSLPGEAPEDTVIREVKQQLIQPDKSPESGRLEYVFQITYLLTPPGRLCLPNDCVTDLTRT